jgi:adenylate kinase family enzyme
MAINLDVPEEVITKRLVDRWIHEPSGRIYNTHFNPPKRPGLDDLTGESLKKRPDDDVSVIKTRIEEYHLLTEPLIDYYRSKNKLYNFKGSSSDEITPPLLALLEKQFPELNKGTH